MHEALSHGRDPDSALVHFAEILTPEEAAVLRRSLDELDGVAQPEPGESPAPQVIRMSMKPMATHMTTWLTSTSHGVATRRLDGRHRSGRRLRTGPSSRSRGRLATHGVRRSVAPVVGAALDRRGQGEDGRGEEDDGQEEASPGSTLAPRRRSADMDIGSLTLRLLPGNQYIRSMAKFITAWIRAWGRWSP